jgi:hypothetical protein
MQTRDDPGVITSGTGTTMKKVLLVTTSLIAISATAPALAADLAARPYTKAPPMVAAIYDWSGFYVGINGGWGTSHNTWTNTAIGGVPFGPVGEGSHDSDGGTVGGQIGYRWQSGNWVFGLEGQGNWADFSGSNFSLAALGATNRTKIDAFGLFTGQIGYAFNNVLLYVKGGGAVTDNKLRSSVRHRVRSQRGNPLGWHRWRRSGICLRSELVGGRRIRSSVHGHQQPPVHQRVPDRGHQYA